MISKEELQERYDALRFENNISHYDALFQIFNDITEVKEIPLEKFIITTARDAWKQENGNTTVNDMIGWILVKVIPPIVKDLEAQIRELKDKLDGQNGGLPKPKRRSAA